MNNRANTTVKRAEWLKARQQFLTKEKAFTRQRDELSRERQALPWLQMDTDYVFQGEAGPIRLSELFENRNQLVVYHFMFAPEWTQGCPSCSFVADHYNPTVVHLNNHDVSLVTVSRAPIEKIKAFKKRMGWSFPWISSFENDFNRDFAVSFTEAEATSGLKVYNHETSPCPISDAPGMSAFLKDKDGTMYLTYSCYARGLDIFLNTYNILDITAKGRNEKEGMDWVRHHDLYGKGELVYPWVENPTNSVRS